MKVYRAGQIIQTGDDLRCGVVDWQCIQEKTFYSAGISIKGIKGRIS
jgi:hypothetical protein